MRDEVTVMSEQTSGRGEHWLDRPVFSGTRISWWALASAAIIVFIVLTRLWDLGSRAYCHDESIHAWESWKLATGQGYIHNPVYHGPLLYHLTALVMALFGDSDVTGAWPPPSAASSSLCRHC
jgi:predicted membrane-bound mannosyltransferase